MRFKHIIVLLSLFLGTMGVSRAATSYYFQRLDVNNGLSQNCVNTILQDRNGFMWFGTRDGLNRYDGTAFKVFRNDFSAGNGLKNNFITSLFEDRGGKIWVGTDMGVCIYDPESERFEAFPLKAANGRSIEKTVTKVGEGRPGRILIAVHNSGLFEYDLDAGTLTNYPLEKYGNVREFAVEKGGKLWLAFYGGIYYTEGPVDDLEHYTLSDGSAPFTREAISKIFFGNHNKMYLSSERNGVYELNLITNDLRKLKLNEGSGRVFVRALIPYTDTQLWIGTEGGVYIYDLNNDRCQRLTSRSFDPYSISDNAIYSIFKDRDDGVWLGSFFGGVNYWSDRNPHFNKYYPSVEEGSIGGYRIREICGGAKADELWIGTEDAGLFRFDKTTRKFHHYAPSGNFPNIHGLCLDGRDLWVGTFSNGVRVIDTETGRMRAYYADDSPQTIRDNYVFSIYKASTGYIYLGTANFLIRYDRRSDSFSRIREVDGNLIYDIREDSSGNLWVATYANGLFFHDSKLGTWEHYGHAGGAGRLPIDKVLSIFEDSRKRIWITTQGGGVCRFIPEEKRFEEFNSTDGLPNDVVFQIKEDDSGIFWMTTNKGLVKFDPDRQKVIKVYTVADGLLSGQFNYKSGYRDQNGDIYFGTTAGMISFGRNDIREQEHSTSLFITDFFLFDQPVPVGVAGSPLKKSIAFSDKLTLKHNQNTFSFHIAALNYASLKSERPMYKLEGIDPEWLPIPESWSISYSWVPHGRYMLRIRNGESGVPGEEKRLEVEIRPPFWLTRTAYGAYVLLFCLGIWLLYSYSDRRNRQKRQRMLDRFKQSKEKELYESKISFFTHVTHEIRTPLTLIKGPLESVLAKDTVTDRETLEDLQIMRQNVNRLHDLTNQLLDFRNSEQESLVLNYVKCDVAQSVRDIFKRFQPLAKQKGYRFSLDVADAAFLATIDTEAFTKIVSNLLTNALKYGDSWIEVCLDTSQAPEGRFGISVKNDGEPIPDDMKEAIFKPFMRYTTSRNSNIPGTGIGLSLARFLAEQHGGALTVDNAAGRTCFTLMLPVEQEHTFDIGVQPESWDDDADTVETDFSHPDDDRTTILIVEDDPSLQKFIHRHLGRKYSVLLAENGEEALRLLSDHLVNIVVSDVMMPVMDGIELCRAIKSNVNYCHIPVILLTAKTLAQSKIEGVEAGADSYIEKPFSMEYLLAVIGNLIRNRSTLKKIFTQYPMTALSNMTTLAKADEDFLRRIHDVIRLNVSNPDLKMKSIAETLNMSRASFYRKIKGVLDLSPNEYLRIERLKEAARLLHDGDYQVSEVCYMVGFNSLSYFSKCFYKQYGVLPKDYAHENGTS